MRILVVVSLLFIVLLVSNAHGDASQQTILFDDFLASQLSPLWQWVPNSPAPATQAGGFLTLTAVGSQSVGVGGTTLFLFNNLTQTTSGLIGANTVDGQYYESIWRLQPFNYTNGGGNVVKNAEVDIGFTTGLANGATFGFGAYIEESDSAIGNTNAILGQKSSVNLWFVKPMASTTNCFETKTMNNGEYAPCSVKNNATLYEPAVGRFDLNTIHVFTWTMKLFPVTHTSWVAFQMDNDGWYNFTQSACACIDGPTGSYQELYPFITLKYCGGIVLGSSTCSATLPNQSVAANLDYLLITNYPVTSIPSGQILPSSASPPSTNQPLGSNGFSLTNFLQFEANSISPGNLYAGGMLLAIIVSGTTFAVMMGISRKASISVKHAGLFFTMFVLVLSFLFFTASILPIWVPVMMTLITMGIVFGVIKTGDAGGGLVPD